MAFSKEIRLHALVAAARHCCVCHRYKGVKVEVHHIVPITAGGADTAENAIALCFDCHADAGHYNADHPRGTRFSPEELRLARDTWHIAVQRNDITAPGEEDLLYCRYLLCTSFSALSEITAGSVGQFPAENPALAKTAPGSFLASIIQRHPDSHRSSHLLGSAYSKREEYERVHPDVRVFERPSSNLFPYFEASRRPSRAELISRVAPKDGLTAVLLEAGIPESEISEAFAYPEVCGDDSFQEIYRLRPLWGAYIAATNTSPHPVRLEALKCEVEVPPDLGFRTLRSRAAARVENLHLPRMPLLPGATAVIPIATVLGPLGPESLHTSRAAYRQVTTGEVQSFSHAQGDHLADRLSLIGPAIWPISFAIECDGNSRDQEVHQLDLSNLYTVDRSWEAGSCPHLFCKRAGDLAIAYWGELWATAPMLLQTNTLIVPPGVERLILAELENEVTHVLGVLVNDVRVTGDAVLNRGQTLCIDTKPGDRVSLVGYYVPDDSVRTHVSDPWQKNRVIAAFVRG